MPRMCPACVQHDWSHQILPSGVSAPKRCILTKTVTETVTVAAYGYMWAVSGAFQIAVPMFTGHVLMGLGTTGKLVVCLHSTHTEVLAFPP